MQPVIVITRPEDDALRFADQIRARVGRDVRIVIAPVMEMVPVGGALDLSDVTRLIFTSRNGVRAFLARSDERGIRCDVVGEATADVARRAGMHIRVGGGTADALVAQLIAADEPERYLHVRGEHVTGDVATRLGEVGINARDMVLYEQREVALSDAALAAMQGEAPVVFPLFSPRTARLVFSNGCVNAPLRVAAMSEKVVRALPEDLNAEVLLARTPTGEGMVDAVITLLDLGKRLEGGNLAQ